METPGEQKELHKSLKLADLILLQLIVIFGFSWVGAAAKQGSAHVVLWCSAFLLFYLPQIAVVVFLSRAIPIEGGLYQWIKQGWSPFAGYLAAWNYLVFWLLLGSSVGIQLTNYISYAIGSSAAWMMSNNAVMVFMVVLACSFAYVVNVRGLGLLRWLSGTSSVVLMLLLGTMIAFLIRKLITAGPFASTPFAFTWPPFSLVTLGVFGKMTVGALSGSECAATAAGECKNPERDLARSVLIAAPILCALYILSTGSVLAHSAPAQVDLATPEAQLLRLGLAGSAGLASVVTAAALLILAIVLVTQMASYIGMASRLPMVAGWDNILPPWWSQLHPKHATPVKALGVVLGSMAVIGIGSLLGVGGQEALQTTSSAGVASVCLVYLMLFAMVTFGMRRGTPPPLWLRVVSGIGFVSSAIALTFQVVPITDVVDVWGFVAKVGGLLLLSNAFASWLYSRSPKLGHD